MKNEVTMTILISYETQVMARLQAVANQGLDEFHLHR